MKREWKKLIGFVFVLALVAPLFFHSISVSAATTPTLNKTSKTIKGKGSTYTLKIKNRPANTKVKWSSSNTKVVKVDGFGRVVAVKKGNAVITCRVVYSNKEYIDLLCRVTVTIPATEVKINNAQLVNNAHVMYPGEKYDFNRTIVPSGSSDKTYWVIEDSDIANVDKNGVVTALKVGATRLIAKTGSTKKAALADDNSVTDAIILNVIEKTCSVAKVDKVDDKTITIQFSHAMNSVDLVNSYGKLNTSNIRIEGKKTNDKNAADLGSIKASLSVDGKTLTLTAANEFDGKYDIKIENDIKSKEGLTFEGYNEEIDYADTQKLKIVSCTRDDTGAFMVITFSKAIDISKMEISCQETAKDGSALNVTTRYIVQANHNYQLSPDKKMLKINLSGIASGDYNKAFGVYLQKVYDTKGNPLEKEVSELIFSTDTSNKPNASLMYVERTGKNTLTAHFDKAIKYGGHLSVNNSVVSGIVNAVDNTCVVYTTANIASLTGQVKVTLSGWGSYNCNSYASNTDYMVDMSVGTKGPSLVESPEYITTVNSTGTVNTIVLTYDKPVTISSSTGSLAATFRDNSSNVYQVSLLYTAKVENNVVTLIIDPSATINSGSYTIVLPVNFVRDTYLNNSEETVVSLGVQVSSGSKLPVPTATQDPNEPSIIYVYFKAKVDITSAESTMNYTLNGTHPSSAVVTSNTDTGSTIRLTFPSGTMPILADYSLAIQNICGYASNTVMDRYTTTLPRLKENKSPVAVTARLSGNTVVITFDDTIHGTADFSVISNGTVVSSTSNAGCYISDKVVIITLTQTVTPTNTYVMKGTKCDLRDASGNKAEISQQMSVTY